MQEQTRPYENMIDSQDLKELSSTLKELDALTNNLKYLPAEITNAEVFQTIGRAYVQVELTKRDIEKQRKDITRKLDETKATIKKPVDKAVMLLDLTLKGIQTKMEHYVGAQIAAEVKKMATEDHYIPSEMAAITDIPQLYRRRKWLVVPTETDLIPDEYFKKTLDVAKLTTLASRTEGKAKVPGIQFTYYYALEVRTLKNTPRRNKCCRKAGERVKYNYSLFLL